MKQLYEQPELSLLMVAIVLASVINFLIARSKSKKLTPDWIFTSNVKFAILGLTLGFITTVYMILWILGYVA